MIYSVDPDLYKSGHLRPLSPIEVLGEFAKNRPGKKFPAAVLTGSDDIHKSLNEFEIW